MNGSVPPKAEATGSNPVGCATFLRRNLQERAPNKPAQRVQIPYTAVSDEALLEALRHPSTRMYGRNDKPMAPWLYAAADQWDSRKADFNRWFVTGPQDRRGYIKGPFPLAQVERVAALAMLSVICREGERPIAYQLGGHEKRERLEAQLRHLTLPTQRGYRRRIERELASMIGIDA